MSAGFTPGPWAAGVRVGGFIDITHSSNKPGDITRALCRVQSRITWAAESMANARLIAAAPELLAALECALEWLEQWDAENDLVPAARAAIAKATGESA